MRYILIILSIILFSSCSVQQMANYHCKRCPTKDSVVVTDSVIVHDTILVTQDRELIIRDTVPCDDFELNKDSGGVKIKVVVKDRVITVKAECEKEYIRFRFLERHKSIFKKSTIKITEKQPKTRFQTFKDYWFWVSVSLLAFIIVRFFLKLAKKWPFPF